MKGLYSEIYKNIAGEIKKNIMKWKDIMCSWFKCFDMGKMSVLCSQNLSMFLMVEIDNILKVI